MNEFKPDTGYKGLVPSNYKWKFFDCIKRGFRTLLGCKAPLSFWCCGHVPEHQWRQGLDSCVRQKNCAFRRLWPRNRCRHCKVDEAGEIESKELNFLREADGTRNATIQTLSSLMLWNVSTTSAEKPPWSRPNPSPKTESHWPSLIIPTIFGSKT